jgi:DNA-binding CsgD family transcriptional regulator
MKRELTEFGKPAVKWPVESTFTRLLDQLSYGVLIVSSTARLIAANAAARGELARRRPFVMERGILSAADEHDVASVREALSKATMGKRSLLMLSNGDAASLPVAVLPVIPCAQPEPGAAFVLSRSMLCDPLMLCFYARGKGMTRTEEVVLGMLGEGRTAPEIAAELRLATSTVRTHIQSLCKKAGATSTRAVMNQLARLPPLHASAALFGAA